MVIKTCLDENCIVSMEHSLIKMEPYQTDGEIYAYTEGNKIRIGVYRTHKIANAVMDEIYEAAAIGENTYTMPGYSYEPVDITKEMENIGIKEAIATIKETPYTVGFNYCKENRMAVNTILNAIANDGYALCKVESAISGMNGLYTKIEEYATASEIVDDCVEILKENCQ